ncbi:MAG: transcription elongation factor GreA [Spirochaetales bacterium]|jgi:transcription elongation factor GreA|nr:transcription elongation factor GreA [Spirochaetales bacterium]
MAENILTTISELLNEEKWTRATINSYTINNFRELDEMVEAVAAGENQEETLAVCEEHLSRSKNSIIALYLSGILSLRKRMLDDSNLLTVINFFVDNHKWNIVEYLCNRILSFGENKYALRLLAECYENENEDEKKQEVWVRLVKIDHEEADIVKQLAERFEAAGRTEDALDYYKKAIYRYINKKSFPQVKDIWHKILDHNPQDIEFFFHVDSKIAKQITPDRSAQLLEELYLTYKKMENWDRCIEILKRILDYDPKNPWARKEITECFRQKYSYHSHLEDYIKLSNLNQSFRSIHEAIEDFQKHISFDVGNFVYHRSWGIGKIKTIEDDEIVINFTRKADHKMSLKMAVGSLTYLEKDHIWVLKVTKKREELKKQIKENIPWALRALIKSYGNQASTKQIKAELVPAILDAKEWNSWSAAARKILKEDPVFANLPDKIDTFKVQENPVSAEEKAYNKFKAETDFFGKYKALSEFLESADAANEYFTEIVSYFAGFLRAYNNVDAQVISSYFIINQITEKYSFLNPGVNQNFKELMDRIPNVESVFMNIESSHLKQLFLQKLKELDGWEKIYLKILPRCLNPSIVAELEKSGKTQELRDLFAQIADNYRDNREAFIWVARNYADEKWCETYGLKYEKILIGMLLLLDITYREISNRREVSLNRRLNKQIQSFLFNDGRLEAYLNTRDQESVTRIYTLVEDVKDLDPSLWIGLKENIIKRFPDFKFYGEITPAGKADVTPRQLTVLEASYKKRQKSYQNLIDVEMPENSREIGAAIELGDLSENAEYKAGKEKQEFLNLSAKKMKDELDKAVIFDSADINLGAVSFGTKVTLQNLLTGSEDIYTILGPWESDPDNRIISYLAPLGMELYGRTQGEELEFVINERSYKLKIVKIERSEFV